MQVCYDSKRVVFLSIVILCDGVIAMRLRIWAVVLNRDTIAIRRRSVVRTRQGHLSVKTGIGPYPTVSS